MFEQNPNEKDESVEIPDFKSIKDEDEINRAKFRLDDEDYDEDDEYEDEEPTTHVVKQSVIVLTIILLVLLLGLSIFGIAFGVSKNKAYNALNTEYEEYKSKALSNETSLNAKIVELQTQLAEKEEEEATAENAVYVVTADAGLRVRKEAKVDGNNFADYDALSDSVKKQCAQDGDAVVVYNGAEFEVSEIKEVDGSKWGKIDTNAWICLDYCEEK